MAMLAVLLSEPSTTNCTGAGRPAPRFRLKSSGIMRPTLACPVSMARRNSPRLPTWAVTTK